MGELLFLESSTRFVERPLALPDGNKDTGCTVLTSPITQVGETPTRSICHHVPTMVEPVQYNWKDMAEGNLDRWLAFDFYKPVASATGRPLIVYFHPNGVTNHLTKTSDVFKNLVQKALTAGWAVASVECRHPVVNELLEDAPPSRGGVGYP